MEQLLPFILLICQEKCCFCLMAVCYSACPFAPTNAMTKRGPSSSPSPGERLSGSQQLSVAPAEPLQGVYHCSVRCLGGTQQRARSYSGEAKSCCSHNVCATVLCADNTDQFEDSQKYFFLPRQWMYICKISFCVVVNCKVLWVRCLVYCSICLCLEGFAACLLRCPRKTAATASAVASQVPRKWGKNFLTQ